MVVPEVPSGPSARRWMIASTMGPRVPSVRSMAGTTEAFRTASPSSSAGKGRSAVTARLPTRRPAVQWYAVVDCGISLRRSTADTLEPWPHRAVVRRDEATLFAGRSALRPEARRA